MADFDNEPDDSLLEQDEKRPSSGDWNRPMLLAGIGLALMLGGYAAISYVPPASAQSEEAQQKLDELRKMAAKRSVEEGADDGLNERLNQIHQQAAQREPPPRYQLLGRLAIYGGLFLFVMAGVLMYRSSPPPRKDQERE
jgi:hypothetical protein